MTLCFLCGVTKISARQFFSAKSLTRKYGEGFEELGMSLAYFTLITLVTTYSGVNYD